MSFFVSSTLFQEIGLTNTIAKTVRCVHHSFRSFRAHWTCIIFQTKSMFDEKYDSCSKTLVVSQKLDLWSDTQVISINHFYHQSVNVNSPIHSTVLSALRRSGKRTCLVWWIQSGFFGGFITTRWKFLSRRIFLKKEILSYHRSVFTKPEGSTSSQNEWQSHIRSLNYC